MVTQEWPLAAPAADRPVDTRGRADDRLSTVRVDFLLDDRDRLSEQERALMIALLSCLLEQISTSLSVALPVSDEPLPSGLELARWLRGRGMLDRPGLIGALLRRAEEDRVAEAMRAQLPPGHPPLLQRLIAHPEAPVAQAAMELLLARGRRRDAFDRVLLDLDDVPAAEARPLVLAVAASLHALRDGAILPRLAAAADDLLARHDPEQSLDMVIGRLEQALGAAGELADWLLDAAGEGEVALVAASLSRRAGLGLEEGWQLLSRPTDGRLELLLAMAGCGRPEAASLVAGLGQPLGVGDPSAAIVRFDAVERASVERAREWLAIDPELRAFVAGQGSVRG